MKKKIISILLCCIILGGQIQTVNASSNGGIMKLIPWKN